MTKKLHSILLIDDDDDANYFHERLLIQMACAEKIGKAYSGKEALEIIKSNIKEKQPNPEIIFLDLNMPGMNGWEFLDEYGKLDKKVKSKMILILLTTSLNPDDQERAKKNPDVMGFYNKFLDKKTLEEILAKYFPEIYV